MIQFFHWGSFGDRGKIIKDVGRKFFCIVSQMFVRILEKASFKAACTINIILIIFRAIVFPQSVQIFRKKGFILETLYKYLLPAYFSNIFSYLPYSDLPEEDRKEYKEKNWVRIFKTSVIIIDWTIRGEWIQATFWELSKEQIRRVRFFRTACAKFWITISAYTDK